MSGSQQQQGKRAQVRKKVDPRIRTLIENGVKQHFRSFFVIVGDKGRDQVVNLHYMLSKTVVKTRPSVLWCYKKDLGFTTHRKKRMREVKKKMARGQYDPDKDDPFELFISSTQIHYTYYSESHKILGNTFGMCILQDFEALEPNLLARTIETVEGGGIVVLLLKTMSSLKQLYTMSMDVHSRLRTESQHDIVGRFNERFLLSLGACKACLVVDDELNILPLSSHSRRIEPLKHLSVTGVETPEDIELKELKSSLKDTEFVGALVNTTKTLDQAKTVLTCIEAISEKNLRTTVAITAARGRGKSAALGIAVACAVASGYSNIFITSPSPENLKTLFEFIFKGFDCLGYQEHLDYDIVQSSNPEFNKAVVRVNVYRTHRQTIQYIHPQDHGKLGQAELVVIDEAAAIPLPYVRKLLGPYLVFMASTVNGYEGTGRSLSLKLIQQLREQSTAVAVTAKSDTQSNSGRVLRELEMKVPIRYGNGDPVEKWLNELLCLDATIVRKIPTGCPHPSKCNLYYVNRDTLFSYHRASETFLQRMMALYVSSHYKNSPNDLLLMSDAPAHHLFVLLGPVDETQNTLPEILTVIQVCLEGELNRETVKLSLSRGKRASGDLIPWTLSQQFQDDGFPSLSGARIVRIATHPNYQRMGYGHRALELITSYYSGDITNLSEVEEQLAKETIEDTTGAEEGDSVLATEEIKPRKNLPPLLAKLEERRPEALHWIGTSFGITQHLFNFWNKQGFLPVYVRQTPNELTGEHSCIMLKSLKSSEEKMVDAGIDWLPSFHSDFKKRFLSLLSYEFSSFTTGLALSVLDYKAATTPEGKKVDDQNQAITQLKRELDFTLSRFDIKRLESYSNNIVDYHVIVDLLPAIARFYFLEKFSYKLADTTRADGDQSNETVVSLSYIQAAILLGLGLQHKAIEHLVDELTLQNNQVLAMFNKAIKKIAKYLRALEEWEISMELPTREQAGAKMASFTPLAKGLDEELDEEAEKSLAALQERQKELLSTLGDEFVIKGTDEDWALELGKKKKGRTVGGVSIKRKVDKKEDDEEKEGKKKGKKGKSPQPNKRKRTK